MTPEQQAAYTFSQSICALVEALGMVSHNYAVKGKEESYGFYRPEHFNALIDKYGISHNAVVSLFQQLGSKDD